MAWRLDSLDTRERVFRLRRGGRRGTADLRHHVEDLLTCSFTAFLARLRIGVNVFIDKLSHLCDPSFVSTKENPSRTARRTDPFGPHNAIP